MLDSRLKLTTNIIFIFKKQIGFTLIELLVVISIIGILASFSVVSLNSARTKARDAKRKADIVQVRLSINLYYDDNDEYPICGIWDGGADNLGATVYCYNEELSNALTAGAKPSMSDLPMDPKNSDIYVYSYVSTSNGDQFALVYETEDELDTSPQIVRGW